MSDLRGRTQLRPGSALRVWRSLLVATTLIGSATIAYLPGYPGAVSAETFVGPDSPLPAVATEQPTQAPTPEP